MDAGKPPAPFLNLFRRGIVCTSQSGYIGGRLAKVSLLMGSGRRKYDVVPVSSVQLASASPSGNIYGAVRPPELRPLYLNPPGIVRRVHVLAGATDGLSECKPTFIGPDIAVFVFVCAAKLVTGGDSQM